MVGVEPFLEQVAEWARDRSDVRAAFVVGSQARTEVPADELSDVDLVLVVDDPALYTESASWLETFGTPLLTFLEPTPVGGLVERRVLFEFGLEVDFSLVPAAALKALLADADALGVFARGYRILHDEVGLNEHFARATDVEPTGATASQLSQLSHDFWYHALWSAKKLRRGEIYVAKQACDGYLKSLVVELLAIKARDSGMETWHQGRFLERWAARSDVAELGRSFARYDEAAVARAIKATSDMFARLEREVCDRRGVGPLVDHDEVGRRLEALLEGEPRRRRD
jgi:aminoglycoside 6-adenylyltransferase